MHKAAYATDQGSANSAFGWKLRFRLVDFYPILTIPGASSDKETLLHVQLFN